MSVADGVLWMLSLYIDEYLATGEAPGPGHYILTGRYACYDVYPAGDGGWLAVGAIEPVFWANLCRLLGLDRWIEHQSDDAAQDEIRADIRRVLAAGRGTSGSPCWPTPTRAWRRCSTSPRWPPIRRWPPEGPSSTPGRRAGRRRSASWRRCWPAARRRDAYDLPDPSATDTEALLAAAGVPAAEIEALLAEGVIA